MILSASRRTDIPCYYSEWFMNRIRAGYVLTRNPMNHAQLSKIPLSPDIVDCIVFWTKDAANMLPHLDELDRLGYRYYFQHTLTPYARTLEASLRPKADIENTFIELSKRIGRERVVWRYDPIILSDTLDIQYHKTQFMRMCGKLSPYTDTVTISFVDMYPKLKTSLIRAITEEEIAELAAFIGKTAKEHDIHAVACCEQDLAKYGIEQSSCIDRERSIDTIAETASYYGKDIITDERLRERQKGADGNNHGMFHKRWSDLTYHEDGGESIMMVQQRNIEALKNILQNNNRKNIVIGTHGTALSSILNYFEKTYNCDSFLRIIDWMPYIIELDFNGEQLLDIKEHLYVQKEFKGAKRADKIDEKETLPLINRSK